MLFEVALLLQCVKAIEEVVPVTDCDGPCRCDELCGVRLCVAPLIPRCAAVDEGGQLIGRFSAVLLKVADLAVVDADEAEEELALRTKGEGGLGAVRWPEQRRRRSSRGCRDGRAS